MKTPTGVLIGGLLLLVLGIGLAHPHAQVSVQRGWNTLAARLSVTGAVSVLSTCGTGTLATGSNDTVGRVTATGATACTVTFSASFGGNSADCAIENMTANRGNVSAASSTAFTVSNLTAADVFVYHCFGR
jgi:hypothetical protein